MSNTRVSLSQQIADLYDTAPNDYDPESDLHQHDGLLPEDPALPIFNTADLSAGREHYIDVDPSEIRKSQLDNISHPKYNAVRISRKQLIDIDQAEEDTSDSDLDSDSANQNNQLHSHDSSSPQPNPKLDSSAKVPTEQLTSTLKKSREEDIKKGKAISRQLAIYDSILDARIRLQKCVTAANRLPHPDVLPSYFVSPEARNATDKMLNAALRLSNDIFDLREKLSTSNDLLDIDLPARKKRRRAEDDDNNNNTDNNNDDNKQDWEDRLIETGRYAASLESAYHPHLLTTLQKWSNKVLSVAPSALMASSSVNNKFSRSGDRGAGGDIKNAVQLIDEVLASGGNEKLIARTRVYRGKSERVGVRVGGHDDSTEQQHGGKKNENETEDTEIFDDTDFYSQLLRDVIDSRTGTYTGDDGENDDWRGNQKMKKLAKKKTIDTKASKGRKLRYETHEKLQNFMVPIPSISSSSLAWHEEQIDELFASLLGRKFGLTNDRNDADIDINVDGNMDRDGDINLNSKLDNPQTIANALSTGFRVFG